MAGGWIKLLRPPSSTYLPRPSDIELRIPVKATLRQRRFVVGSMTNVRQPPSPSVSHRPPRRPPRRIPLASLNDDDNIAQSEWPDDTRADTPRPCYWPVRRMDGIRGFRRLAASLERPGRMRSCQDMRNPLA